MKRKYFVRFSILLAMCMCIASCDFQIGVSQHLYIYKAKADYSNQIFIWIDTTRTHIYQKPKKDEINEYAKPTILRDNYHMVHGFGRHNGWDHNDYCHHVPTSLTIDQAAALDTLSDEDLLKMVVDFEPYLEFYGTNRNKVISKLTDVDKCNKIIKEGKITKYMSPYRKCSICQDCQIEEP